MTTTTGDLAATPHIDHTSPRVAAFVAEHVPDRAASRAEIARALYYAVRDRVRYEVYGADLSREGLSASRVLDTGSGMCIHKSLVYAAALRAAGVPSRLVLTDVRNHLASERLRALVGGDVFRYHCLTSVHTEHGWVRATPVFNRVLCRLYRIAPLEFDGTTDSLRHPYDQSGRRTMEFLHEHGEFADLPYDAVIAGLRAAHPGRPARRGNTVFRSSPRAPSRNSSNTACASTGAWVMPAATALSDPSTARTVLDLCAQRALTTWDPSAKLPILSALAQIAAVTTQDWAATAVAVPKILAEVAAVRAAYDKRIAEERQHRKNIVQAEWTVDIPDPIPATAEEFGEYARLVRPPGASAVGEALLTASLLRWCRLRWQENMVMLGRREYLQQHFGRPRLIAAALPVWLRGGGVRDVSWSGVGSGVWPGSRGGRESRRPGWLPRPWLR